MEIEGARLPVPDGEPVPAVPLGTRLRLEVDYVARAPLGELVFGFLQHRSTDKLTLYDGNVTARERGIAIRPSEPFTVHFDFSAHVTRGQYHLACRVFDEHVGRHVARVSPAGVVTVAETRTLRGVADLELRCSA